MALQPGLYKVEFRTKLGSGTGVLVIEQGRVRGGDSSLAYSGTYEEKGDNFSAKVNVARHSSGLASVFGIDNVSITLSGVSAGTSAQAKGTSPQAPGISFEAHLSRLPLS